MRDGGGEDTGVEVERLEVPVPMFNTTHGKAQIHELLLLCSVFPCF